ncbi:MAG: 1,4-alpha-glucan branching protein GlgB [Nitriliruptorales bacterium]|nr:1,4-alpha-glucan branching protein GlgB [Nitriliruptorales bacterium]
MAEDIARWLPHQRWFAGKARAIERARIADFAGLGEGLVMVIVEVDYADVQASSSRERYQVPLVATTDSATEDVVAVAAGVAFRDALRDADACRHLATLTMRPTRLLTSAAATLTSDPVDPAPLRGPVRRMGVEQSNSSVVFADALILKVLRRLEPGENPEVELTRALTRQGSPHVLALRGSLIRTSADANVTALAILSDFVPGGLEGWALATTEAEAVGRGDERERPSLSDQAGHLGAAVARVHAALGEALGTRPATSADVDDWIRAMLAQRERVLTVAKRRAPEAVAPVLAATADIDRTLKAVATAPDPGVLSRVHGDLHLGQVLLDRSGTWRILDFEGEPARSMAERRRPSSPLRDVAGMVRSFDYTVGHAVHQGTDESRLGPWRDLLRRTFLEGYFEPAREAGMLPADERSTQVLLGAFELDKAIYELGYELANRPDWVPIPTHGIRRVLDRARAGRGDHALDPQLANKGTPMPRTSRRPQATRGAARGPVAAREAARPAWQAHPDEVRALIEGRHRDPHRVLGAHEAGDGAVVRVYRPDAESVEVLLPEGSTVSAERTDNAGFFEAPLDGLPGASTYRVRVRYPGGSTFELVDPYGFWPTLGPMDLHLAGEGRHEELWQRMGARVHTANHIRGTSFAVWAPNAQGVRVVADFNTWDGRLHPMRMLGDSGIWELFIPDVGGGTYYKYEIVTAQGHLVTRADPYALATEVPPGTASRVHESTYEWGDAEWMDGHDGAPISSPMAIYEVHLGSWRHRDGRPFTYRELAEDLVGHVTYLGFTHVEFLPVAEHPFGGSWGYQVTGHYAPTARFGDPDDFRYLVDRLHQAGIGVIVDWVPAHFPKDEWALARFDGTALYEHADPRRGEHPDWGTLVFNFGRNEVRNFLIANALFWLEELHVDGLRVDAVASMLYLDYSRAEGEWVPNAFGGRENLEAVDFLKDLNSVVYARNPHALMIAEESTAWPGVSRPAYLGGLGFGFKWNMGWMHDTLDYLSRDPIHRRFHHHQLTFALMYAFSENFVLPLSHDEVVHGKRSMVAKMPGDRWQKFANLRALYGCMWAHPGKQLLFMGSEFGQWREWSEGRELDWDLLAEPDHSGLQTMVADLNHRYRELPALWQRDTRPEGFTWIDANNADDNVLAFIRWGEEGSQAVVCVSNFSPVVRRLRVGLPAAGGFREVLNTDAGNYGGSNIGNYGAVTAEERGWHGQPASAELTLPPLATIWLAKA